MPKTLPKYIVEKIETANRLAYKVEELNQEVEDWMEKNGVEYAWDALFPHREDHGYTVPVEAVQEIMDGVE